MRLCGNWPGIGRRDELLGPYLENDLKHGVLTLDEAREILAHFFIKGCEWICGGNYGSGDAQHYQNLVIAGIDENGNDVTNDVTYLILDIIEELGISDFPTTVRLSSKSPEKLTVAGKFRCRARRISDTSRTIFCSCFRKRR
jgi:formate C-acetyltransferase